MALRDWLIGLAVGIALAVVLIATDAFESLYYFTREREDLELDEIILVLVAGIFGLFLSLWLRARHAIITTKQAEFKLSEQLIETQKARQITEVASRAKSDFLRTMSHELRTPLNSIQGFGQLLNTDPDAPLNEKQQRFLDRITTSTNHLLALIDDLLELGRIETGSVNLEPTQVDLQHMINDCIQMMRRHATDKRVTIEFVPMDDTARYATADPVRLRQVLINLLSNAIKYNCDGGSITICSSVTDQKQIQISIADTGQGIPEDQLHKLYVPFERLGAETTDIQGTGVGLAVTKQLIELMEGTIGVETTPGTGSTFWITVPPAIKPVQPSI